VIDSEGFRPNVAIVICNDKQELFFAKRKGQNAWQFPQGGIESSESPIQAMYRELEEEVGILPEHVEVIGCTKAWLRYRLPKRFLRKDSMPLCIGQKQIWYLLKFTAEESFVKLDLSDKPEFDHWRWTDYWSPAEEVVFFKQDVYRKALTELSPLLFDDNTQPAPQ
jgi:putative (di)nucleoside polyphosphate hydrolase